MPAGGHDELPIAETVVQAIGGADERRCQKTALRSRRLEASAERYARSRTDQRLGRAVEDALYRTGRGSTAHRRAGDIHQCQNEGDCRQVPSRDADAGIVRWHNDDREDPSAPRHPPPSRELGRCRRATRSSSPAQSRRK
jgi:hypothetical protein